MTVRGFLSFGGLEIPSKAAADFHGLKPYIRESRRTLIAPEEYRPGHGLEHHESIDSYGRQI